MDMTPSPISSIVALTLLAVIGCSKAEAPVVDTAAAMTPAASAAAPAPAGDKEAVRAVNVSWFKAYNARDVDAIAALYADDAVLSAPGAPSARGAAAIKEAFRKDIAAATKAGIANNSGTSEEVGVSGDLAWESNTYSATDKSGKVVEKGKYVTVFERRNGKWVIIRDIWNSDGPPPA
jgi:uncharacterized protein (TIGR02246 family)